LDVLICDVNGDLEFEINLNAKVIGETESLKLKCQTLKKKSTTIKENIIITYN